MAISTSEKTDSIKCNLAGELATVNIIIGEIDDRENANIT
jgi:hypothetical protein